MTRTTRKARRQDDVPLRQTEEFIQAVFELWHIHRCPLAIIAAAVSAPEATNENTGRASLETVERWKRPQIVATDAIFYSRLMMLWKAAEALKMAGETDVGAALQRITAYGEGQSLVSLISQGNRKLINRALVRWGRRSTPRL